MRLAPALLSFALPALLLPTTAAVKHDNFKTCDQSGFCKRNRAYADSVNAAGSTWKSPYRIDESSIDFKSGIFTATILKPVVGSDGATSQIELPLKISLATDGVARVQIDEKRRQNGDITLRHDSKARKERYNEAEKWALVGDDVQDIHTDAKLEKSKGLSKLTYGFSEIQLLVEHDPFKVTMLKQNVPVIVLNGKGFLNLEHWREKKELQEGEEKKEGGEDESTWWEETFGGNTDSKPRGPEAVAMDITFPGYEVVYGVPEHASSLSLKETRGGEGNYKEPYRLYNADVFEYEVNSPMTLYGSIPFMQALKKYSTVGVFWLNAAETWIDIVKNRKNAGDGVKGDTETHWISESGVLDVFLLPGPTAGYLYEQYGRLTGWTALPAEFSLGYHQCRWNYISSDDVKEVDRMMDKFDIPYDVIWLDIEYTDDKKYFTWDPLTFNDPVGMQEQLAARNRKLVAIIDPHIKNVGGYNISAQMNEKGLAVKDSGAKKSYDGWCWPGSSNWIDCFNPAAREWWKTLFTFKNFPGSTENLHVWNDMNEPSVFNGPETTMPKDNLHHDNWEHRDVHNLYGMTLHNTTYEGLLERFGKGKERRGFVLTRSFFAGSQRTTAMWTGDNLADWSHLAAAFPMILNQGISGMPFAGADVGGFFGNPGKELLTRWYQSGAFYPFFRAHAHIDAKRREPYLIDEPYRSVIRDAIRLRYSLLPMWYTAFHRASFEGMPVIRPMSMQWADDEECFEIDDQFFLGDSGLLVKPIVTEGATETEIYVGDDEVYYDYLDQEHAIYRGKGYHKMSAPLEKTPILLRGGHMVLRRDRHRRSTGLMKHDPYTLVMALSTNGSAGGVIYIDDGETFDNKKGDYIYRAFTIKTAEEEMKSINIHVGPGDGVEYAAKTKDLRVEKVIVLGVPDEWLKKKTVTVTVGTNTWTADVTTTKGGKGKPNVMTIRDPKLPVSVDWNLRFGAPKVDEEAGHSEL